MAADLETFRMLFPEFVEKDPTIQFWIDRAANYLNKSIFGDCFDDAVLYWAAHKLALLNSRKNRISTAGRSAPGVISSASVDGTSTSFAINKTITDGGLGESQYAKTEYGQEYLAIRENAIPGGMLGGTPAAKVKQRDA